MIPIAVNLPDPDDLESDDARPLQRRHCLSQGTGPLRLAAFARCEPGVRHPAQMAALAWLAITSARLDLPLAARRLVHLAYALLVVEVCRRPGVRTSTPTSVRHRPPIAWFASRHRQLLATVSGGRGASRSTASRTSSTSVPRAST